jgi:hypothetical protein
VARYDDESPSTYSAHPKTQTSGGSSSGGRLIKLPVAISFIPPLPSFDMVSHNNNNNKFLCFILAAAVVYINLGIEFKKNVFKQQQIVYECLGDLRKVKATGFNRVFSRLKKCRGALLFMDMIYFLLLRLLILPSPLHNVRPACSLLYVRMHEVILQLQNRNFV